METSVVFLYQLVEFIDEKLNMGSRSVDCVPTKWVEFDLVMGKCLTRFMPPPYGKSKSQKLHDMIRNNEDAPPEWPRYAIQICGAAESYTQGMQRLERLKSNDYAYSTDCENAKERAEQTSQVLANQARRTQEDIQKTMNVPALGKSVSPLLLSPVKNLSFDDSSSSTETSADENCNTVLSHSMVKSKEQQSTKKGPGGKSTIARKGLEMQVMLPSSTISSASCSAKKKSDAHLPVYSKGFGTKQHTSNNVTASQSTAEALKERHHTIRNSNLCSPQSWKTLQSFSNSAGIDEESLLDQTCVSNDLVEGRVQSQDLKLILCELKRLTFEQRELSLSINKLGNILDDVVAALAKTDSPIYEVFDKKYKLQLPLTTYEDFIEFDEHLKTDDSFRSALVRSLSMKFDEKVSITKNLAAALRKYMSRDLAQSFTAQRIVAGKYVFNKTELSACLLDVIDMMVEKQLIKAVSDHDYLVHLGAVLVNAKDWGVPRRDRQRRN